MKLDDRHRRAARLLRDGLTQEEAGEAAGVSGRTIRAWRQSGKLAAALEDSRDEGSRPEGEPEGPEAGRAGMGPGAARGDGTPPGKALSLSAARARKEAALAEKHELELGRLRGDLVPLACVEALIRDATRPVDLGLGSAPRELAPEWSRRFGVSEGEALHAIRELCDEIRGRLTSAIEVSVAKARGATG